MRKNEKITALYERLSRDDFGKDDDQQRESNSISNQQLMENERLCFSVLSDYARILRSWKVQYAPQSPAEAPDERFIEACHNLDQTEYYLDILCAGDSYERAEVIRQQMADEKLEELRQRLEEIHKEDENDNNTAGVA